MMRPPSSAAPAVVLRGANPAWDVVRIPESSHTLAGFRTWADSEQFPESGRIDFLGGDVEVDVSPEDLHTHGTLKSALAAALFGAVARSRRGHVFVDRIRVTSREADLSVEPDLVAVLFTSLDAGRVRQVPSARGGDRFIELEGAPDLVVEIVSDTSERKDTERLPPRYAHAGIPELLADRRPRRRAEVRGARARRRHLPAGSTRSDPLGQLPAARPGPPGPRGDSALRLALRAGDCRLSSSPSQETRGLARQPAGKLHNPPAGHKTRWMARKPLGSRKTRGVAVKSVGWPGNPPGSGKSWEATKATSWP